MTSFQTLAAAFAALLLIVPAVMGGPASNKVITWGGNTPEWNRALHLGALRLGCSDPPSSCAGYAQQMSRSQGVDKVFLSVALNAEKTPVYVREYSRLSLNHPEIYEIGLDDFVGQCDKLNMTLPALSAFLVQITHDLKAGNPKLNFGITVYEDELYSDHLPLGDLDEQFRKSVDFVHLYPHYRQEKQSFSAASQQALKIFPQAKIIAGVYAYDRRDYVPCTRGNSTPCTNDQEVNLFAESFKERLGMLGSGGVQWIEFYPGSFGDEATWPSWTSSRICKPERLQECLSNTNAMREVVRKILNSQNGSS
jgi:hypothetical protein